jgi:hypothetical protein
MADQLCRQGLCRKCGLPWEAEPHRHTPSEFDHPFDPAPPEAKRTPPPLVHSATASGRNVYLTTYLEGGTVPIKATLLFWCQEDAAECARVLSAALSTRPRDPRWGP